MFTFLKNLFRKKNSHEEKYLPLVDESGQMIDDPMLSEVLNRAWQTGNPVIGNLSEDGTFEVKELK